MKCINHPVSPAVGQCAGCEIPLCGVCANFIGEAVYCDKCEKIHDSERFVAAKKAQLEKRSSDEVFGQVDQEQVEKEEQARIKRRNIQIGIIAVCALIVSVRLLFFTVSQQQAEEVFTPQFSLPVTALPECLAVFQEIGEILASGGQPLPTLRCADSAVPPIISRDNGVVRASHPNPGAYGLSELYVTSDNPLPQLVE